jgi:hypothetical protein
LPDKDGKVDMSNFSFEENEIAANENNFYNFDFGLYNPSTNTIFDANKRMPGMYVFEKSINHFIASFGDRQVFLFKITTVPLK